MGADHGPASVSAEPKKPALVSVDEAALAIGISPRTARRLVKATGELVPGVPAFRIGGRIKFHRVQLEDFVAGRGLT